MKKISILFSILLVFISSLTAQTASDYYLPLNVGNFMQLHTTNIPANSGWGARTTIYTFLRSENINSVPYFVEEGREIMDNNVNDNSVFRIFWMRKDANGNIVSGAYSTTENNDLSSATIINPPFKYFPNEYLTKGFSQTFQTGNNVTETDSVVSVTATYGSYNNCIQIRAIRRTNGTIDMIEDSFYAYHIGLIGNQRTLPINQCYTSYVTNYLANSPSGTDNLSADQHFKLYPNPATEGFYIDVAESTASVSIYNLNGTALINKSFTGKTYFDIHLLPTSIYFVKTTTNDKVFENKLIKK